MFEIAKTAGGYASTLTTLVSYRFSNLIADSYETFSTRRITLDDTVF